MSDRKLVVLDWGHLGQSPPRHLARGAEYGNTVEVYDIGGYLLPMMRALREFGIAVQIIGAGSYQDRQRAAVSAAAAHQKVAYVSCHLNAFPDLNIPQRSSVFFDKRSSGGRTLAAHIATALDSVRVGGSRLPTRARPSNPKDWTKNAWFCGGGDIIFNGPAHISGVCLEPLSVNAQPAITPQMLEDVGIAAGRGIALWLDQ